MMIFVQPVSRITPVEDVCSRAILETLLVFGTFMMGASSVSTGFRTMSKSSLFMMRVYPFLFRQQMWSFGGGE
jgi:hypothetical protein